jgi:RNA polymerase sigma factor (TIGR02999 family)
MAALNGDVTLLLASIRDGDVEAVSRLAELVYSELHRIAERLMSDESPAHTLQPTALLNEAFLRLFHGNGLHRVPNRRYFFAAAVRAMRTLLVEYARRRKASKRGGRMRRLPFDDMLDSCAEQQFDVEALHEGLEALSMLHERSAQVVTLRFFGGFTVDEVAAQLGVSVSTVEADFRFARAWLRDRLTAGA